MDRAPLSYRRLGEHVHSAAAWLRSAGLESGSSAALVLPNGPLAATTFLATATAGGCAPLNPAYRAEEFAFYLDDLKARLLLVAEELDSPVRAEAQKRGIRIVEISAPADAPAGIFTLDGQVPQGGAPPEPAPAATALILHTSGTTARPKMVPLTQANLSASAAHIGATLGLGPDDSCLNVMPLFHIHGLVAGVLSSLRAGATVTCAPGFLAPSFFQWLRHAEPTWYTAVPTIHQAILSRASEPANRDILQSHRLRFARSSSAALPRRVLEELERVLGVPVVEAYGMTEAAHQMASNPLPPGIRKPGSVGLAAGPEMAILDATGARVAPGAPGEVCIRGPNVTAGYVNNPEANARTFTEGWLRTGDEGMLDGDGYLTLTGRLKEQINRAGEKISPLEVDGVLLDHPAVASALSFSVAHPVLGEDIAAAVVLRPEGRVTERQLRDYVATRLAYFKTPRRIVFVDAIPTGPTGKLQRLGLAERLKITAEVPVDDLDSTPPRTAVEEIVAAAWAEVMEKPVPGVRRNFFALGGDSILATRLVARLREQLAVELPLLALFDAPSVEGIAAAVEDLLREPDESAPSPAAPALRSAGLEHLDYWRAALEGAPLGADLPTDLPRTSQADFALHTERLPLPPGLVTNLEKQAQAHGTTLDLLLLAAFRALLFRLGRQEDLTIGAMLAGKDGVDRTSLIRTRVTESTTLANILEEAGLRIGQAWEHSAPLEAVVAAVGAPPDWTLPLVFSFNAADQPAAELGLAIARGGHGVDAVMTLRANLYEHDTARRFLRLYHTLLIAVADGTTGPVSRYSLFQDRERAQVLGLAPGPELSAPIDRNIGELFVDQAAQSADRVALVFEGTRWTFGVLAARAGELADELRRRDVGAGVIVAVIADRSLEMIMAMVAVTLAGGAYVPLDPDQPGERIQSMLEDAGAMLVLADAEGERLSGGRVPILRIDQPLERTAGKDHAPRRAGPEDPVYVIFTSGSTGRPKGVMIPHRALVNHTEWVRRTVPILTSDVVLQRTSIGFDASIWEIWGPLLAGGTIVLAPKDPSADPVSIGDTIREHGVTLLQLVPSLLSLLLEMDALRGCDTLKGVLAGGERLSLDLVRRFQAVHSMELLNLYGPTEVTIDSTLWRCPPRFGGTTVPIGRPVANLRVYVLDPHGEPTPIGVPGELYVGGAGVALGYLNQPELTAARFVPDRFGPPGSGPMYRTGDHARFLANGDVEYLGRVDDQLKLHGIRIEPGEIEALLNACSGVLESAVGVVTDRRGGMRLIAWVVPHPGTTLSAELLRKDLTRALPPSLVPGGVMFLERLPRTSSEKINRGALPVPMADGADPVQYEPPTTPTEKRVAQAWSEILRTPNIGRHDDLYALGGHSLMAIRIANRLRSDDGIEIPLRTFLEHPVLSSLAAELDRLSVDGPPVAEAAIPKISRAARVARPASISTSPPAS